MHKLLFLEEGKYNVISIKRKIVKQGEDNYVHKK